MGDRASRLRRFDETALATCTPSDHSNRPRKRRILSDDAFERAAALFRAAGHVTRLKLLARLAEGEWCVTELATAAGVGLSTVSQQLRLLRLERIVECRWSGKHAFYSLADSHVIELITNALEHASEARSASDVEDLA